jgi:hypothetical protein
MTPICDSRKANPIADTITALRDNGLGCHSGVGLFAIRRAGRSG